MKTIRQITSGILGVGVAIWYTAVHHSPWWMVVAAIITSIAIFAWINTKVNNTILWIVVIVACFFGMRAIGLPILDFVVGIWVGLLSLAFSVIVWSFKTWGVLAGIILFIIILACLKSLMS